MTAERGIPDRLVVSAEERRPALLDVIRQARTRITLSLFRCNDQAVFDALQCGDRSRRGRRSAGHLARQGRQEEDDEAVARAGADRRLAPFVHRSGGEVSPQVSRRGRGAGDRRVAEPHEEVLPKNARRSRRHPRPGRCRRPAPALDRGPRPPGDAGGHLRPPDRRAGARAPAVHRADRRGTHQHSPDRCEALGSRSRVAAEREARRRHDGRAVFGQAGSGT